MDIHVEVKGADIYFEENRYLRIVFKENINIDLEVAKEITDRIAKISGHIPHGNIIDASKLFFMTKDAREHFAAQEKGNAKCIAIITKSKIQAGFANLYLKFTKRKIETKSFEDIISAKAWISSKFI